MSFCRVNDDLVDGLREVEVKGLEVFLVDEVLGRLNRAKLPMIALSLWCKKAYDVGARAYVLLKSCGNR